MSKNELYPVGQKVITSYKAGNVNHYVKGEVVHGYKDGTFRVRFESGAERRFNVYGGSYGKERPRLRVWPMHEVHAQDWANGMDWGWEAQSIAWAIEERRNARRKEKVCSFFREWLASEPVRDFLAAPSERYWVGWFHPLAGVSLTLAVRLTDGGFEAACVYVTDTGLTYAHDGYYPTRTIEEAIYNVLRYTPLAETGEPQVG